MIDDDVSDCLFPLYSGALLGISYQWHLYNQK